MNESIEGRLEYLRGEIRAERISWGGIAELQELAPHINRGDVELLEWAGVPEHPLRWLVVVPVLVGVEAADQMDAENEAQRIVSAHHLLVHIDEGAGHVITALEADDDTPLDALPRQCLES